jgi:hypothetical protein
MSGGQLELRARRPDGQHHPREPRDRLELAEPLAAKRRVHARVGPPLAVTLFLGMRNHFISGLQIKLLHCHRQV